MSMLEDWLNMFGGNDSLKPNTPKSTAAEAWRTNARNTPSTKPNIPASSAPNVPQPKMAPPTYAQSQAAAAAGSSVDGGVPAKSVPKTPVRMSTLDRARGRTPVQGPDVKLSNAAQKAALHTTPTYIDSSGNKVNIPEGYEWDKTKGKLKKIAGKVSSAVSKVVKPLEPILKPLGAISKVANAPLMALTSEKLGRPEDLPESEMWAWTEGTEDFTGSTFDVRNDLGAIQSEYDKESTQAIAVAEENLKIMREVDASPEMIAGAEKNLADVKASAGNAAAESTASAQEELDNVNLRISQIFERYGPANAATAKLEAEGQGLFDDKAKLENKLTDISLVQEYNSNKAKADEVVIKAEGDDEAQRVIAAAKKAKIAADLKESDRLAAEEAARKALEAYGDGYSLKEAMSGASKFLGELWGDKAIQNALVYYMGSRLMGYSSSGSGMAAGQVLLQGWENQTDADTATAEANAKSAENDAIDMSKTVNYVDKYGNFQKVYASKNGKYLNHPQLGTIDVTKTGWRPAATGEKDRQTRKLDATDSVNRIQDQVLNKLNSQTKNADGEGMYDKGNVANVTQMFQEAGLSQQMVDSYTDSYGIDGLEKSIPMLRRAIESYASAVALGEEVNIASLMGHLDRSMITSGKTQVPKSIYHSEGKVVSSDAMNTLSVELNKVHGVQNDMIARVEASAMTEDQKTEFIYTMKTEATKADILIQLNKSFNAIPPKHMDFWKKQAKDSKMSSPFIMWMSSTTDPGRQNSSYNSLNINVYRDLGLMPSNKKE